MALNLAVSLISLSDLHTIALRLCVETVQAGWLAELVGWLGWLSWLSWLAKLAELAGRIGWLTGWLAVEIILLQILLHSLIEIQQKTFHEAQKTRRKDTRRGQQTRTQDKDTRQGHQTRTTDKDTRRGRKTRTQNKDTKQGLQTRTQNKDIAQGHQTRT